ncbi:hypothetical protein Bpfe_006089 [Biomphalaria pfeifferi]|uniref:Uncharacterized protein n=1 Tax=Biomphalaria pfeifferi TaxID=112525 RepID=A0AAD8FHE4_BIOPF|nr:hypothetical protein Bpfe_006089 [Biomphalaria pfeifferi]
MFFASGGVNIGNIDAYNIFYFFVSDIFSIYLHCQHRLHPHRLQNQTDPPRSEEDDLESRQCQMVNEDDDDDFTDHMPCVRSDSHHLLLYQLFRS